nr:delta(12)-fatty acid conjugase [Momordica charantia]
MGGRGAIGVVRNGGGPKKKMGPGQGLGPGERITHARPPFSISQIKKAIPPHCFQRSLRRSFSYLLSDIALVSAFYYVADTYFHRLPHPLLHYLAWPVYWFCQGAVLTGMWGIAHDCGHHAFSDYQLVDDVVGFLIHSLVFVPYFSFKISHRRHHSNTSSVDRDEVFVPKPKAKMPWYFKYLTNPPARVFIIFITLTLGWPMYLTFNISGRYYGRFTSHFDPNSPIFSPKERVLVHISNAGLVATGYLLYRIAMAKGVGWLIRLYGVPLIVLNACVVLITALQHTHPSFPYYDSTEWDWLRGNLVTVDRDYGPIMNRVFHHITDTHVVHHLFPSMPHYNGKEATVAAKRILGEYYQFDGTPIWKAAWREFRECVYVEPDEDDGATSGSSSKGVFWYHNKL